MRLLISCSLVLLLALEPSVGPSLAQEAGISREHDAWGRFEPGAWSLVREVTETLDEEGHVAEKTIRDTTTTLLKVEKDGVTLELEAVHEVAGKRFIKEPKTIKQGFHGELFCQDLKIKELETEQVVIEGRKIPCKILQLECNRPGSKTVTKLYYSATVAPYILRRHSVTSNAEGNNSRSETIVDVVDLEMPCKVLAETKSSADVRAVQKHPKGTTITRAIISIDVPGGIVSHRSKGVDKNGRVIRRSTLELIDYGLEPEPKRAGLLRRRQGVLLRKTPPRRLPY